MNSASFAAYEPRLKTPDLGTSDIRKDTLPINIKKMDVNYRATKYKFLFYGEYIKATSKTADITTIYTTTQQLSELNVHVRFTFPRIHFQFYNKALMRH